MPPLSETRASNSSVHFTYTPVAVFVGGTGGIAAYTAELLARYTEGNIHVIVAGRNRTDGTKVLDSLAKPLKYQESDDKSAEPLREFVFCDASSINSVHAAGESITSTLKQRFGNEKPRINFLVFSAGYADIFHNFTTEDGLDLQLTMRYYHRCKMAYELMPLLRNARDMGQDAKYLSILGAGVKYPVDPNDFGFKNLGTIGNIFKALRTCMASAAYNDLLIEEFASRERGVSFTHAYPGLVRTAQLDFAFRQHWLFRPLRPFFDYLLYATTIPAGESAEWTLYGLLSASPEGKGFYRRGSNGQELNPGGYNDPKRKLVRERLFEHSISETRAKEISPT